MDELSSASTDDLMNQTFAILSPPGGASSSSTTTDNGDRERGLFTEMPPNHPTVTLSTQVDESAREAVTTVNILVYEPCRLQLRVASPLPDDGAA